MEWGPATLIKPPLPPTGLETAGRFRDEFPWNLEEIVVLYHTLGTKRPLLLDTEAIMLRVRVIHLRETAGQWLDNAPTSDRATF